MDEFLRLGVRGERTMAADRVETAEPRTEHGRRLRVAQAQVRAPLLNPRTVVGALLVTLSGLGLFVVAAGDDDHGGSVVVAARDLRPGQRIGPADLALAKGALPASIGAFAAVEDVSGRVVLGPVGAGEVVPPAAVSEERPGSTSFREVALSLPRAQVAVGRLGIGDRVDVFVTDEDRTSSVVRGATVVHLAEGGGGLAAGREVRLVVAVEDDASVAALVHALRTGDVTVVRSTLAAEQGAPVVHPPTSDPAEEERGDHDG